MCHIFLGDKNRKPNRKQDRPILFSGCRTISGPRTGELCVFPFIYNSVEYSHCTGVDHNVNWCSVEVDDSGQYVQDKWGNCGSMCSGIP